MHDKFKTHRRVRKADDRLRRQIATEAAKRLLGTRQAAGDRVASSEVTPEALATAKRQAVRLLGHLVRPGDLPTDSEVREQMIALARSARPFTPDAVEDSPINPSTADSIANHLDRFAVFKLRLEPLQAIKLNPKSHPEGDALFHALQVFELAREARPYDEEFLLAALLHEVARASDPLDPGATAATLLAGTVTERTAWLIEHLPDLTPRPGRQLTPRTIQSLRQSEYFEDLEMLDELDRAGREPGARIGTIDEAIEYLRRLEQSTDGDDER